MRFDLKDHLCELAKTSDLFYRPNGGNAGDSLIACATFQLLEREQIAFRLIERDDFDPTGKVVLYAGGGNLVPEYASARQFVERCHEAAKRLVILPHTIFGNEDLLPKLGPNVDVFAREEVSFNHVKKHAPHANVFLEDDLAFGLDVESFLAEGCSFPYRHVPLKRVVRRDVALLREAIYRSFGRNVLNCFRTDKERTDIRLPFGNMDISKLFKCGTEAPGPALCATRLIFRFIDQYEEVRTNRLHVAIAGALLGKRVKLYPNSYFKNSAIYSFSIKDRFPNVQWMGD